MYPQLLIDIETVTHTNPQYWKKKNIGHYSKYQSVHHN